MRAKQLGYMSGPRQCGGITPHKRRSVKLPAPFAIELRSSSAHSIARARVTNRPWLMNSSPDWHPLLDCGSDKRQRQLGDPRSTYERLAAEHRPMKLSAKSARLQYRARSDAGAYDTSSGRGARLAGTLRLGRACRCRWVTQGSVPSGAAAHWARG